MCRPSDGIKIQLKIDAVYICTADENAFLQLFSEKLYGIPPKNVMGTQVKLEYVYDGKNSEVVRTGEGQYLNNWDGKPRQIQSVTGKKAILAGGNSNGDYHMLEWAQMNGGLALLIYHTDGEREDKYDKHTKLVIPMMKRTGGTIICRSQRQNPSKSIASGPVRNLFSVCGHLNACSNTMASPFPFLRPVDHGRSEGYYSMELCGVITKVGC